MVAATAECQVARIPMVVERQVLALPPMALQGDLPFSLPVTTARDLAVLIRQDLLEKAVVALEPVDLRVTVDVDNAAVLVVAAVEAAVLVVMVALEERVKAYRLAVVVSAEAVVLVQRRMALPALLVTRQRVGKVVAEVAAALAALVVTVAQAARVAVVVAVVEAA